MYSVIVAAATQLGEDWPSNLRNIINYRPGCGYREVIKKGQIDTLRYLQKADHLTIEKLVDSFENQLVAITGKGDPSTNPAPLCRLLLQLTLLLQALATNLHEDLISRHSLDSRWAGLRNRFYQRQGLLLDSVLWPY